LQLEINSKENKLVKHIVKLASDAQYRIEQKQFVIYGLHLIQEAMTYDKLKTLIIEANSRSKYEYLINAAGNVEIIFASKAIVSKLNVLDSAVDIIGVAIWSEIEFSDTILNEDCVLLENIQDPGNLGTILRSCKAFGVNNILMSNNCVDKLNPKVVRASQGAIYSLNVFSAVDIVEFISKYKHQIIATTPRAEKVIFDTCLSTTTAWIFGNEGAGITDKVLSLLKLQVKIPLLNNTESINVAMATGICLYEQQKQRQIANKCKE
jgi:TrmH family RNA methyltransferase